MNYEIKGTRNKEARLHVHMMPAVSSTIESSLKESQSERSMEERSMFVVENEFNNANITRSIRFTEKLFEELNGFATQNGVSFNLLVLQCCRYALDQAQQEE